MLEQIFLVAVVCGQNCVVRQWLTGGFIHFDMFVDALSMGALYMCKCFICG